MNQEILKLARQALYIAASIAVLAIIGNLFRDTYDFKTQTGSSAGFKLNKRNGTLEWCDVGTTQPSGKTVVICLPEKRFDHDKYLKDTTSNKLLPR